MGSTQKRGQWFFGMKAHIGVDSRSQLIHSVVAAAANVSDSVVLEDLLHGDETRVWGDKAYAGKKSTPAIRTSKRDGQTSNKTNYSSQSAST